MARKQKKQPEVKTELTKIIDKTPKGRKKRNTKKSKLNDNNVIQEATNQDNALISPKIRKKNSRITKTVKPCPVHGTEIVVDGNVLNADFIPFTTPTTNASLGEVACFPSLSSVSDTSGNHEYSTSKKAEDPVTITVDDDEDDSGHISVCIDDTDCCSDSDSINDSVQIVKEMNLTKAQKCSSKVEDTPDVQISLCKKRKLDDSVEILELCNSKSNRLTKKPRKIANVDSSSAISSSVIEIIESHNNCKQDNDIVIVDAVDNNSRDSVMVLKDSAPTRNSSTLLRGKRRKMMINHVNIEKRNDKPHFSSVFQDTIGNAQMSSARYKSPLSSIVNKDSDQSVSYHNVNGNNMYNPNSVQKTGLRPVVIDGSNVAFGHGGNSFSTRGIEICVNYFVKRGHWVVAFVPLFRRSEVSDADRKILDDLQNKRLLAFTPSRFLHGRRVASYDDRFIVQCAAELGGIVVSTDNYRDLVCENEAWRETIEKRLLMFTWVGDILMFPDDPNGRGGPRLEEFLRFPQ